jgi:hypothetical protein
MSAAPRLEAARVALLALATACLVAACGPGDTIVIVMPGAAPVDAGAANETPGNPDAAAPSGSGDATAPAGPSGGADAGGRDAGIPNQDAAIPSIDGGIPSADAGRLGADAGARDAGVVRPDPAPYGCADAPFNADGGVCLVRDACTRGANYQASAGLDCTADWLPELVTCASSSPYLARGYPVQPTGLLRLGDLQSFPVYVRTPEVTTGALACPVECAGVPSNATGVIRFELALPFRERVTVKVGPPWKVTTALANPFCVPPTTPGRASCAALDVQSTIVTVYTTEFYAPTRDVIVDVSARTPCP